MGPAEVQTLRLIGALAGTLLAFLFSWPTSWGDFCRRLVFSLIAGIIFGPIARDVVGADASSENILASSAFIAFISWPMSPNMIAAFRKMVDRVGDIWKPKP